MIEIRRFQPGDRDNVVALWTQVFAYDTPHNDPIASLDRKLSVGDDLLLVATVDGEVVGTVMGGYDGHRGWVYSLAVSPQHRRCGLGTKLMRHLEGVLIEQGAPKINLQVVADNADVVAFYESLGYRVEPRVNLGKIIDR